MEIPLSIYEIIYNVFIHDENSEWVTLGFLHINAVGCVLSIYYTIAQLLLIYFTKQRQAYFRNRKLELEQRRLEEKIARLEEERRRLEEEQESDDDDDDEDDGEEEESDESESAEVPVVRKRVWEKRGRKGNHRRGRKNRRRNRRRNRRQQRRNNSNFDGAGSSRAMMESSEDEDDSEFPDDFDPEPIVPPKLLVLTSALSLVFILGVYYRIYWAMIPFVFFCCMQASSTFIAAVSYFIITTHRNLNSTIHNLLVKYTLPGEVFKFGKMIYLGGYAILQIYFACVTCRCYYHAWSEA